jgi:phage gpG-like protein
MTNTVKVTVDDRQVLDVLAEIARRCTPEGMAPYMRLVGDKLAESTTRRFATGTAPDGTPWAPLKPGTVLARYAELLHGTKSAHHAKGKNAGRVKATATPVMLRPLIATGDLSKNIHYQLIDGGAGVEIGTNRTFDEKKGVGAEVHQFGTQDGHIPARPFLGLSADDKTTVLEILAQLLQVSGG